MEYTVITSRQNPKVKSVCALSEKKERVRSGLFRFDGVKLFAEADAKGVEIVSVFVCESAFTDLQIRVGDALMRHGEQVVLVSDSVFEKLTEEKAPEGILTVARQLTSLHPLYADAVSVGALAKSAGSICLLESIRDPGNLGTMIRTACAMGIEQLILSDDCADLYHPRTVRAAMGALFCQKIARLGKDAMPDAIAHLRRVGRRVFAAALQEDAMRLGEESLRMGDCVVIGNEGHGLTAETILACDRCVLIPMQEGSESLNAATAAAICMWELACTQREREGRHEK